MITPRDEWRGLGAATRRTVERNARQLRPHPDPRVAAVAERYARHALDRWSRRNVRWGIALGAGAVAGISVAFASASAGAGTILVTAVTLLLFLAVVTTPALRLRLLTRVELANRLALGPAVDDGLTGGEGLTPDERAVLLGQQTLAGRDLSVGFDRGRILRQQALLAGLGGIVEALAWVPGTGGVARAFLVFLGAMLIVLVALGAARMARWGALGRPILRLDDRGVHMPRYGYTLPWPELAEVRLIPLHGARRRGGRPVMIVALVPADPEAALRELQGNGGGRAFERSWRLHGTPLTLADRLMTQTAEQVAATASAFAALPVRRY